jgi:putative hydroxymethylpyrimidine transport system substrate-binding protein
MRRSAPLLLVAALAFAGCGASNHDSGAASPRPLTLMLDWTPNPDHVAIFLAQRKGYFAQAGLDVTVHTPSDPTTPLKLVAAGRADLAVSYEPELFFAAEKRLPVVAVAALVPRPLDSLISLRPLPSLAGHSVGITGVPTDDAFLATLLAHARTPRDRVKVVHVGYDLVPALLAHRVDAILGGYRNVEGIQLAQRGLHPTILPVDRGGVPRYDELVVAANAKRLRSDAGYAGDVKHFVAALARGTHAAVSEPRAALAAAEAETRAPRGFLRRSVRATAPLLRGAPCLSQREWKAFGEWMFARKLVSRLVAASDVMATAYLPRGCA